MLPICLQHIDGNSCDADHDNLCTNQDKHKSMKEKCIICVHGIYCLRKTEKHAGTSLFDTQDGIVPLGDVSRAK